MIRVRRLQILTVVFGISAGNYTSLMAASAVPAPAASAPAPSPQTALGVRPSPEEVVAQISKPGSLSLIPERIALFGEVMTAAVEREPANNRWQFGLALVERFQGKQAEQLERMKRVVKAEPTNSHYRFELGQAYMASITREMGMLSMAGRAGDARDAWEEAIRLDPTNIYAHYAAAQYYIEARKQGGILFGSYSKAAGHGEALLKVPNQRGEFWGRLVLGQVAGAQEKWDEMSRQFVAAETAPGDGADPKVALLMYANALLNEKKDADAALPVLARYETRGTDPNDTNLPFFRGMANKNLGHCDKATPDFQKVLAINAAARNTRFALAECLDQAGDRPGAIAQYEEFTKRFPKDDRAKSAEEAVKRLRRSGA